LNEKIGSAIPRSYYRDSTVYLGKDPKGKDPFDSQLEKQARDRNATRANPVEKKLHSTEISNKLCLYFFHEKSSSTLTKIRLVFLKMWTI
jgi:hypothetical protein